jgi:membrane fusion protein, peptide pheromone/bacteriocin exporter
MIIPSDQANDTLVVTLSTPSTVFRFVLYGLLLMLLFLVGWAYWSVVGITITASGSIRPSEGVQSYAALATTMVESVYVAENQRIRKGDTLLAFSAADIDLQLSELRTQLDQLQKEIADVHNLIRLTDTPSHFLLPHFRAEYDAIQKELQLNRVELSTNQIKFNRSKELRNKQLISDAEHEDVQRSFDMSRSKMEGYLQSKISFFQQMLFNKKTSERELRNKRQLLFEERRKRFIIANADGYLYQITVKKGGVQAIAGQELISLTPTTALRTEFYVAAKDIGFIRNGFGVRYEIDAFPYQEWGFAEGNILSISNDIIVDSRTGAQYFKVIGSLQKETLTSHRYEHTASLTRGLNFKAIVTVAEKRLLEMLYDKSISYFVFHR